MHTARKEEQSQQEGKDRVKIQQERECSQRKKRERRKGTHTQEGEEEFICRTYLFSVLSLTVHVCLCWVSAIYTFVWGGITSKVTGVGKEENSSKRDANISREGGSATDSVPFCIDSLLLDV